MHDVTALQHYRKTEESRQALSAAAMRLALHELWKVEQLMRLARANSALKERHVEIQVAIMDLENELASAAMQIGGNA
jgi:hypothetical protein